MNRARVTVQQVAKDAGVVRGTAYYHYKNLNDAISASENALVKEFSDFLEKRLPTGRSPNKQIFLILLLFMSRQKKFFTQICSDINNQKILYRLMEPIYPKLQITWYPENMPAPAIGSERACMYFKMIVEVISRWGKETHCDFRKADRYIDKLIRLTNEASLHCR